MKLEDVAVSLVVGCGAVFFPCVRERRRAQAEREREYTANFALLQQENEKRVRQLNAFSVQQQQRAGLSERLQQQQQQQQPSPPEYQEVETTSEKSRGDHGDGHGSERRSSAVGGVERVMEEARMSDDDDNDDDKQVRHSRIRRSMPVSQRDWAAVTTVSTPALGSTATTRPSVARTIVT